MSVPRRRRSSHPAIAGAVIAAVATVIAAAIPVALELTRDSSGGGAAPPVQGAPSSGQPSPTPPAAPTDPAPTPESPAVTASPSPPAGVVPLTEMREVDDFEGWEQEPLTVAGKRHEAVLTASPCWLNDSFTVTFVVSRQFRVFEAAVGIADESPKAMPLRFTVLSDRKEVFTTTVGLGRTRPVKVDISDSTQVSLRVSTTSVEQCHGDSLGAWIAPRVRR
ncbi:NPCBM/NEW2 domain-containing protein [Micromonospora sp. DSM 115977]|uniref:NPCBM/NEW2 domain-containing protein n=1 Tax=Micromonospora reichwaldensis TaxID=3075516 RepID=A0ABU2X4N5_9ACTN|nr:NPCBM/NEW2 domain-containing protein [Micromonospora sp. DSM 115977]MDT0533159.1 NPCBM/NEW2 domain-containing protein [Micromonospora sp. DSM 115977]